MFVDLIVLAGFLKKIPDEFVDEFENKIINIHPALLPSYGGKGMYGLNVHKAVFEARDKISGATVHFVDKVHDNGKIISQRSVNIDDLKSAEEIGISNLPAIEKFFKKLISLTTDTQIDYIKTISR